MKKWNYLLVGVGFLQSCYIQKGKKQESVQKPNFLIIYTDDVGYGDLSSFGGKIPTPHLDFLANNGVKHLRAYATAATSTPSRFSLLTGEYAWRKKGRGVVAGDAKALIPAGRQTVASVMKKAGYRTAIVGKWHLGLGGGDGPEWNANISNSPMDIGFDYNFIMPSTSDRVPIVLMEGRRIVNLDPNDPIQVSYKQKIGDWPTGRENPEMLRLKPSHGHDMTIVNGISRIGYQYGGKSALFRDEDLADQFVEKSIQFIQKNKEESFFLMLNTNDIHVPRMPHERFQGKSGYGLRGDAILSLDESVGRLTQFLKDENLLGNTIIIFSSDNGPVLDDGYQDQAKELLGEHNPWQGLRGGKYSSYEAGTRVPMFIYWQNHIQPKVSYNLISQVDLLANLAAFTHQNFDENQSPDTRNQWEAWLGNNSTGRDYVVQEALRLNMSLTDGRYKYIEATERPAKVAWETGIETGLSKDEQLYDLKLDPQEKNNIALENPALVAKFKQILEEEKGVK